MELFFSRGTFESLLTWLAGISVLTFFLSLLLVPLLISKLSPDCFLRLHTSQNKAAQASLASLLFGVLKNILGFFLLIAGVAMLFLPGQGILTMLLGILLISFPGKKRLVTHIIGFPQVRHGLDWLRKKSGKQPFTWP